jgi:hypothetical protein
MATALRCPALADPSCITLRALAGLSLDLNISPDGDCDSSGRAGPAVRAALWTGPGRGTARAMAVWHRAPLHRCYALKLTGSTDAEEPVVWIGACAIELASLDEARRAAAWLQRQQSEARA